MALLIHLPVPPPPHTVLLAKWLVSLTSDREVPGSIPTGSRFFCAVTRGIGYSWPGMRVKCILYTVGYIILGRNARLYSDVKLKYLYTFYTQPTAATALLNRHIHVLSHYPQDWKGGPKPTQWHHPQLNTTHPIMLCFFTADSSVDVLAGQLLHSVSNRSVCKFAVRNVISCVFSCFITHRMTSSLR